jgi:hypothetical protein
MLIISQIASDESRVFSPESAHITTGVCACVCSDVLTYGLDRE